MDCGVLEVVEDLLEGEGAAGEVGDAQVLQLEHGLQVGALGEGEVLDDLGGVRVVERGGEEGARLVQLGGQCLLVLEGRVVVEL